MSSALSNQLSAFKFGEQPTEQVVNGDMLRKAYEDWRLRMVPRFEVVYKTHIAPYLLTAAHGGEREHTAKFPLQSNQGQDSYVHGFCEWVQQAMNIKAIPHTMSGSKTVFIGTFCTGGSATYAVDIKFVW